MVTRIANKEVELRVTGMLSTLDVVTEKHGAAVRARAIDAMPANVRDPLRSGRLLPSTWIPISAYAAMLRGIALDDDAMRAIGQAAVERDINTIYRTVFKFLAPETLARQTPRMWGIYFRGGDIQVIESSRTHCRVRYAECVGFDRLVWQDYIAGAEAVLKFCGAKNAHTVIEEGGTADLTVASARWE